MTEEKKLKTLKEAEADILQCGLDFQQESEAVVSKRWPTNLRNWDAYHGRMDWTHKRDGESAVYLHKTAVAVEQICSLFKAAFINFDKFLSIERINGRQLNTAGQDIFDGIFTDNVVTGILQYFLEKAEIKTALPDAWKVGLLESLAIIKIGSEMESVERYINPSKHRLKVKKAIRWKLCLDVLGGYDYFPDPEREGLYEIHRITTDKDNLRELCRTEENKDGIYDPEKLELLPPDADLVKEQSKKRNAGDPLVGPSAGRRVRTTIYECWARKVYDRDGKVMEVLDEDGNSVKLENVVFTFSKAGIVVQLPEANPHWHARSPFVAAPLLRVPLAQWGKAVMDAAVELNMNLSELFSMMLDGAYNSAYNVKVIRPDLLEDPSQVDDGILANDTLIASSTAPLNAEILQSIKLGEVHPDTMNFFNVMDSTFAENAMVNQIRLGGLPHGEQKATAIVQSSQAISGIFDGITEDFEPKFLVPLVEKAWMDILQNVDKFPVDEIARLIKGDQDVITKQLHLLNELTPQQRFRVAANGFKFKGVGLKAMTDRLKDFQRIAQFLQTLGGNQFLFDAFNERYSMSALLGKVVEDLGINAEEIEKTEKEKEFERQKQLMIQQAIAQSKMDKGASAQEGQANPPSPDQAPMGQPGAEAEVGNGAGITGG